MIVLLDAEIGFWPGVLMRLLWIAPSEFGKMAHQIGVIGAADVLGTRPFPYPHSHRT